MKKRQFKNAGKIPIGEKKQICDKIPEYEEFKKFESGKLYINGEQVELENFLKDGILKLVKINREDSCTFLDLNDF